MAGYTEEIVTYQVTNCSCNKICGPSKVFDIGAILVRIKCYTFCITYHLNGSVQICSGLRLLMKGKSYSWITLDFRKVVWQCGRFNFISLCSFFLNSTAKELIIKTNLHLPQSYRYVFDPRGIGIAHSFHPVDSFLVVFVFVNFHHGSMRICFGPTLQYKTGRQSQPFTGKIQIQLIQWKQQPPRQY